MLKGNKVLLRPIKRPDIKFFVKWFNDPEIIQYFSMHLPTTEWDEEKYIEKLSNKKEKNDVLFVIEVADNGRKKPIGKCGLVNIEYKDRHAIFGIAIGEKNYWGNNHGSEAARLLIDYGFKQLNLHRITSFVYEFNDRSIKMHKKLGFQEEGRCRKEVFKNGQFWDKIIFGLLEKEWSK